MGIPLFLCKSGTEKKAIPVISVRIGKISRQPYTYPMVCTCPFRIPFRIHHNPFPRAESRSHLKITFVFSKTIQNWPIPYPPYPYPHDSPWSTIANTKTKRQTTWMSLNCILKGAFVLKEFGLNLKENSKRKEGSKIVYIRKSIVYWTPKNLMPPQKIRIEVYTHRFSSKKIQIPPKDTTLKARIKRKMWDPLQTPSA